MPNDLEIATKRLEAKFTSIFKETDLQALKKVSICE